MSGMFEPKTDKASRKMARTQKEQKEKRRSRIISISIITVLLLVTAVAILVNSSFIRRTLPVVTIDGVNFSTTEFEFFFNSEYMEYANFMSQFQGMGVSMPDPGRPLSGQIQNPETGETWADLMVERTLERLKNLVSLHNAAKANGFELSQEQRNEMEDEIAMVQMQATFGGFPSFDSLLQQMFGSSINEKIFREVTEFVKTAGDYSEFVRESFVYSTADLAAYYNENKDELDIINYRSLIVYAEEPDVDEFITDAELEAAYQTAVEEARLQAAAIANGIENEEDFIQAAGEYREYYTEPELTLRANQAGRLDASSSDWLLDEQRNYGDVTVLYTEHGSEIIMFVSRDDNNYQTVGMRQILISREFIDPEDFPEGENDPGYLAALEQADLDARERAESVHSLFVTAGESEDALIDLMAEHSDDTTFGGYYTDITKFPYQSQHFQTMKVVPEIEEWLFDENRVVGDSELVYTSAFGYHLLYFMGLGDPFFELIAEDRMRTRDHTEWIDGLPLGEPVRHFAFILVTM